jgi:hypothetical protein
LPGPPSAEAQVRRRAEELSEVSDRVSASRVEAAHRHHCQGNIYHARLDLAVPSECIAVNRALPEYRAHENRTSLIATPSRRRRSSSVRQFRVARTSSSVGKRPVAFFE